MRWRRVFSYTGIVAAAFLISIYFTVSILLKTGETVVCPDVKGKNVDDAKKLLETVIPRYIETQVYQAILEALASEHVARMFAMRNATENATEIIYELTLTYNQARQAFITQEIAEISAGKAALSQ